MFEKSQIDQAAERYETERANLYRTDGSRRHTDEEHAEKETALRREFGAALDAVAPAIETRIETAEQEVLKLEHADPSAALTAEELTSAGARRAFVESEVFRLDADGLAQRARAVIATGDRSGMFLYANAIRAKAGDPIFGSEAERLGLQEIAGELEAALDPERSGKWQKAKQELEEARELKNYAYYRRNGAKDGVELYMNTVYGQRS